MKKKVFGRKLSRSRPSREALFSSLMKAVVLSGKIVTTKAKAKAIQGQLERMVTLAKSGTLSARRKVLSVFDNSKEETSLLFGKVASSFKEKNSGFTRIINLESRRGDNAKMVRLEWTVDIVEPVKPKKESEVKSNKVKKTVKKAKETKKK